MPPTTRTLVALTATSILAACALGAGEFRPVSEPLAISPQGQLAADYTMIAGPDQEEIGAAEVWSNGTFEGEVDGAERTLVHVGFNLSNETGDTIRFQPELLQLGSATLAATVAENIPVAIVQGPERIAAGQEDARVDAYFALPPGTEPPDLSAFSVRWALTDGPTIHTQETRFVKAGA